MMKNRSILVRLLALLITTIAIMTYLTNVVVSNRLKEVLEEEIHEEMFVILQSLDWAMRPLLEDKNEEEIQRLIDNIASHPVVEYIRLYGVEQVINYSNQPLEKGQYIENACVIGVFNTNAIKKSRENFDAGVFEAAIPIRGGNYTHETGSDIQAVLYISADMDYIIGLWNKVTKDFQWVFVGANITLLVIIAIYILLVIGRPFNEFIKASKAITNKDYKYTIDSHMYGEFEYLRETYNTMSESIKEYIDELAMAKVEAEQASEAKMIFLTNMSHEIRTPLNSILGFAEILEEQETDDDKKNELKIIHKSGQHLLTVINDLLDFSKVESNQMEVENIVFAVRELIRDTSSFFSIQFKRKNIDYRYEIDSCVPFHCRGDQNKIRQILINLINNAIKFTKEGEIELLVDYKEPYLIMTVKDTGIGIDPKKIETIFNAFSQADNSIARKYGGTGLGLAICKKFARMLDGDITVESRANEGSEFVVYVKIVALKSSKLLGRSIFSKWLNVDSELSDLVYDTVMTLPARMETVESHYESKEFHELAEEIHALKGLTGNFQMEELYSLFVAADKEIKKEYTDFLKLQDILMDAQSLIEMVSEAAKNHFRKDGTKIEQTDHYDAVDYNSDLEQGLFPSDDFRALSQHHDKQHQEKHLNILIAEDIRENQLLLQKILKSYVKKMTFANNGVEAMELMKVEKFDCLLLDIQMPIMSGEDVLSEINRLKTETIAPYFPYIIVVTAHATLDEKNRCIELGADDYISKPINKEKLREMIKNL